MNAFGDLLMIFGSCFALLAAIGIHRFPDVYSRMHAAAKSPTLGLVLAAIGAGIRIWTFAAVATLFLVVVLQLLTAPVATNVTARAVHLRTRVPLDGEDELARDEVAGRWAIGSGPDGAAPPDPEEVDHPAGDEGPRR